ncbi:MAG: hypothetical protein KBC12_01540 [Candidatus Pacebacteria bacterium]|nr:hypothetical protein [Candidatus Paceibacterota bacterium]MBP9851491.1 hypothetical protein [Candidatus Paceibacterota bacterium]
MEKLKDTMKGAHKSIHFWVVLFFAIFLLFVFLIAPATLSNVSYEHGEALINKAEEKIEEIMDTSSVPALDKEDYDKRMAMLANNPPPPQPIIKKVKQPDGTFIEETTIPVVKPTGWPVKSAYPKDGAILPFNRVVAYYGNLYSKKMGVLGEYPEAEMLSKLNAEVLKWEIADPATPVIPALHYIAVVAQASAGADGKYKARMPYKEIDKVLAMAEKINGIVFIDIQVSLSDLQSELPYFEKYLKMPNVHLGIDPEFSMKTGKRPGSVIGTFDATDINFASEYLANLVTANNLPPKILVIHRFTEKMVTNYKNIKLRPEVQVVMDMDGWGHQARKLNTYKQFVQKQPVQFAGFKLFYKNDLKEENARMLTPSELMDLHPQPIYIQYQ